MTAHRLAALTSALALAGCAAVRDLAASAFQRPTLTFESASVEGLDLEGVTVVLHFRLGNPNSVGARLSRLGYALDVEDRRVVSGSLPGGLEIPSRGAAPLPVAVRVRFAALPGLVEALGSKDEVAYRISGDAGVDTPIGTLDLPFQHSGRVPVPRPPGFSIESARVVGGALAPGIALRLRVSNRNAFPLPEGRIEYRVEVAGRPVARAATATLAPVPAKGSASVELPVQVDLLAAGSALAAALQGGSVEVAVHGDAGFATVRVPLDLRGRAGR
jgi:LEA14-like dessication related protein